MVEGRVVIIPFLQGKFDSDGTLREPDIEEILATWKKRHPEYCGPARDIRIIRATTYLEDGTETVFVRATAAFSDDIAAYDPRQDSDLYDEFVAEPEPSARREFHKIWIDQCEAAEGIEAEYDTDKAMGYLIGEKLLNFLEVAERDAVWRAELPSFIAKIKELFEPWQIKQFLETPRRLGALGNASDEEGHRLLRSQVDDSENLREDARNLMLFEQAREWLLEGGGD